MLCSTCKRQMTNFVQFMIHIDLPADANTVQIRAFFKAAIRSSSDIIDLYDNSLYL